jgi:hypothetical protein
MSDLIYAIIVTTHGQEIFAKVDQNMNEGEKFLILKDPMIDTDYHNEDGSITSSLMRFTMASEENTLPITKQHVLSCIAMSESFSEYYDAAVELSLLSLQLFQKNIKKTAKLMRESLAEIEDLPDGLTITKPDTNTVH